MDEFAVAAYWGRTALAGATVLGVGRVALLVARSPATRQRLAAGTLRAAVLVPLLTLLPSWWAITVPATPPAPVVEAVVVEPVAPPAELPALPVEWVNAAEFVEVEAPALDAVEAPPVVVAEPEPVAAVPPRPWTWRDAVAGVVAVYAVGVAYFLGVFALGHLALVRLRRGATAAPGRVRAVWGSQKPPALLVHGALASPVCFGVVRPAVVLPAGLAASATAEQLAWVLAHEADHLRRGDPLTGWFAGLAKALFFFAPWFWGVRRELRLAQEYLADAAALAVGGHAADYAEFLVDLTAAPVRGRRTSLAHGVRAGRSDLSRRITMVLSTTPPRAPRRWATPAAVGLFAVAVALSGVTVVRAGKPPTPTEETNRSRLDGWTVLAKNAAVLHDKPSAEPKPAKTAQPDPMDERDWQVVPSKGRVPVDMNKLRKQIDEALAAGKTDEAKKLIDALVKSLTPPTPPAPPAQPAGAKPPMPPAPPAAPGSPTAPRVVSPAEAQQQQEQLKALVVAAAQAGKVYADLAALRVKRDESIKALEKLLEASKDAATRAALQSAIEMMRGQPFVNSAWSPDPVTYSVELNPGAQVFRSLSPSPKDFGLKVEPVPEALAEQLQLASGSGLVVTEVRPDSPFAKAGVNKNDVVTAVGSVRLTNGVEQLRVELTKAKPGKVTVTLISKGVEKTVEIEVSKPLEALRRPAAPKKVRFESKSVTIVNGDFTIDATTGGVRFQIGGKLADGKIASYTVAITDGKDVTTLTQTGDAIVLTEAGQKYKAALVDLLDSVRGQ